MLILLPLAIGLSGFLSTLATILFVSLLLLVIILILGSPKVNFPYKQYAIWFVAGLWIIFLLIEAWQIAGLPF